MRRGSWAYSQGQGPTPHRGQQGSRFQQRAQIGSHGSRPTKQAPATKETQCQRCEKYGHHTADCTNAPVYKSRPTRTQQLLNPKKQPKLLSASESFDAQPSKEGVADKILGQKAEERDRKRGRSSTGSDSSEDSDSDSDSGSDDSSEDNDRSRDDQRRRDTSRSPSRSPPRQKLRVQED